MKPCIHRAFGVHRFFRRYGAILGGGAAALGLILLVLISTIQNANRPPATIGLGPLEVARLYYESINRIDPETLRDCLVSDDDPDLSGTHPPLRDRTGPHRSGTHVPLGGPARGWRKGCAPSQSAPVLAWGAPSGASFLMYN